jgi:hypothetical protein
MIVGQGSLGIFWSNGIVGTLTTLALLFAALPVLSWLRRDHSKTS